MDMRSTLIAAALALVAFTDLPTSHATGLATCESGDPSGWQSQDKLKEQLVAKGWKVNRIKVDGGCYEVYAIDAKGKRVEAYFHPRTLAAVPTKQR